MDGIGDGPEHVRHDRECPLHHPGRPRPNDDVRGGVPDAAANALVRAALAKYEELLPLLREHQPGVLPPP